MVGRSAMAPPPVCLKTAQMMMIYGLIGVTANWPQNIIPIYQIGIIPINYHNYVEQETKCYVLFTL